MSDLDVLNEIPPHLAAREPTEQAIAGERSAWVDFYRTHDPIIRAIARHAGVSPSDVEDVAQDIWLRLFRRLPRLSLDPAQGTLDGWIAKVARRQARKLARRQLRHRNESLTAELAVDLLDPAAGPDEQMERQEWKWRVQAVVMELGERMPELNRRIIIRYWIDGQSVPAIAAELHMSPDCVGSIIRRAHPKLRDLLSRAGTDADLKKN